MSIDLIGSFYTNGAEAHALKTVVAIPEALSFDGSGTASYSGLFGAGSLITNITCASTGALSSTVTIAAIGMSGALTGDIIKFTGYSTIAGYGKQAGFTLPQDSWLQASGTGLIPALVVSYLS